MISVINKQFLTVAQQCQHIEFTLLAGLEPKLGQIICASNLGGNVTAIVKVKREIRLNYLES